MKIKIDKIKQDPTWKITIYKFKNDKEYTNEIIVALNNKAICKFIPTNTTEFTMKIGEFESSSEENQSIIFKNLK